MHLIALSRIVLWVRATGRVPSEHSKRAALHNAVEVSGSFGRPAADGGRVAIGCRTAAGVLHVKCWAASSQRHARCSDDGDGEVTQQREPVMVFLDYDARKVGDVKTSDVPPEAPDLLIWDATEEVAASGRPIENTARALSPALVRWYPMRECGDVAPSGSNCEMTSPSHAAR
jgi:hypothetical protein